jgi:hypothetical protein
VAEAATRRFPGRLANVGAGRRVGGKRGAANAQHERVGGREADLLDAWPPKDRVAVPGAVAGGGDHCDVMSLRPQGPDAAGDAWEAWLLGQPSLCWSRRAVVPGTAPKASADAAVSDLRDAVSVSRGTDVVRGALLGRPRRLGRPVRRPGPGLC